MKLIDRYILKNFLVPFLYILVSLLGLFLVYDVSSKTARFLKQQVPFLTILRFYSLYLPQLIALGLPMVILLAIVLGVGKMSRNNEIAAMRACGVSVLRITRPLFAAGVLLAVIGFFLFEKVVTRTYGETERFEQALKGEKPVTDVVSGGHLLTDDAGSVLLFDTYRPKDRTFENISWEKETENPGAKIIVAARRAEWRENSWWAFGVKVVYPDDSYRLYPKKEMSDWDFRPEDVTGQRFPEERSLAELQKHVRRYGAIPKEVRANQIEFHRRIALPLLNLMVIAVALPFALRGGKRSGSAAIGVGICILLGLSYYGLSVLFLLLRSMPAWIAVWLPNLLFAAGGLTATLRID